MTLYKKPLETMNTKKIQISNLINMNDPGCVIDEVKTIILLIFPAFDFGQLDEAFEAVVRLFEGKYPGYQGCNTRYHDLKHTTDTLLVLTRLIHGAVLSGQSFSKRNVDLGLVSALFHDTGYIQKTADQSGTGAKYTVVHISRSIEFMKDYFAKNGYSRKDLSDGIEILNYTGLHGKLKNRQTKTRQIELIGKMLGSADLIGQMGDRTYLEKLLFLFNEFKEANVGDYMSELDLLEKTIEFYETTKNRLIRDFDGVNKFLWFHFKNRWNIDRDLYADTIDNNIKYLEMILNNHKEDYRLYLRRIKGQQKPAR